MGRDRCCPCALRPDWAGRYTGIRSAFTPSLWPHPVPDGAGARIFITIPAGQVGVLWLRFGGTVTDYYFGEGIHAIFPWDEVCIYHARQQNRARIYDTISSNGLGMQVEIAIRYRINRDTVGLLHQLVGPQYDEVLVYPEIGWQAAS